MELVTVFRSFNPSEAQLVRSRLDAAGIAAMVTHEGSALSMEGYAMAVGGIRVQVPSDQAERAREVIESKGDTTSDHVSPPETSSEE